MATTFRGGVLVRLIGEYANPPGHALTAPVESLGLEFESVLATGTGANQADKMFVASGSSPVSYDLSAGAGSAPVDAYGNQLTFSKIVGLFLRNHSSTSGTIVTASGTMMLAFFPSVGPAVQVRNDGACLLWSAGDGYTVTNATRDLLDITLSGTPSPTYTLILVGRS